MEYIFTSQRYLNIVLSNNVLKQTATSKKSSSIHAENTQVSVQLDKFPQSEHIHVTASRSRNRALLAPRNPLLPPPGHYLPPRIITTLTSNTMASLLLVLVLYVHEIIYYVFFCVWLLLLSILPGRFIHITVCSSNAKPLQFKLTYSRNT